MAPHPRRERRRREEGAVLLLVAVSMVLLLVIAAFAIDLGTARSSKRSTQQASDLAALAAGYFLAGNGSSPATSEPARACAAALTSAQTNLEGFSPYADLASRLAACTGEGFPSTADTCSAASSWDLVVTDGPYTVTIAYPVTDPTIARAEFAGAGLEDGTDPCERMSVVIRKTDETAFARVIGIDDLDVTATAVVRGAPELPTGGVAALVLLEREGCRALQTSGQGAVVVQTVTDATSGEERPGVIQVDAAGSTTYGGPLQCSTNTNASGYSIYGTALPAASGGGPSIVAQNVVDGAGSVVADGVIASWAASRGGRDACCFPGGLSVAPTAVNDPTSRLPADERYNPTERRALEDLHEDTYRDTVTEGAALESVLPLSANVISGAQCGAPLPAYTQPGTLNVNCPTGFSVPNGSTVTITASKVKFIGGVSVSGTLNVVAPEVEVTRPTPASNDGRLVVTGTARFPTTTRLAIAGTQSSCTNNNNCSALRVTGALQFHGGGPLDGSEAGNSCTARPEAATIATTGGIVDVSGSLKLCETMVYVGRNQADYVEQWRTDVPGFLCTTSLPCPVSTTASSRDRFSLNGGNSTIEWTAPDQIDAPPSAAEPFESLALWVEGTGLSQIKGTGNLNTTGVFVLPNATFEFQGQAAANNPFDAQFFTRTLNFSGQGDLNLKPDPTNAIPSPVPGSSALIR